MASTNNQDMVTFKYTQFNTGIGDYYAGHLNSSDKMLLRYIYFLYCIHGYIIRTTLCELFIEICKYGYLIEVQLKI